VGTVCRATAGRRRLVALHVPLLVVTASAVAATALALRAPPSTSDVARNAAIALDAVAGLGIAGAPAAVRGYRLWRSGIADVDTMTGEEFEARLASVFEVLGAEVVRTGRSGDFGADLVVERGGTRTVVQAKRRGAPVGIDAVQQVIGARRYYDADGATVVTNSSFTRAALSLAEAAGVEVVDRHALVGLLATSGACGPPFAGPALLVRQIACGVRLAAYVLWSCLRLCLWLLALGLRAMRAAIRALWGALR
jgi:restriction system protein